jgi:AmiR/NasT family two-component response regulator
VSKGKCLIVEDEFVVAENLRTDLVSMGYEVTGLVASGKESLNLVKKNRPDIVVMDIKILGDMDGVDIAVQLRKEFGIPVLFLTAFAEESYLERAKLAEPLGYIVKPYDRVGLRAGIEMAFYKFRSEGLMRQKGQQSV